MARPHELQQSLFRLGCVPFGHGILAEEEDRTHEGSPSRRVHLVYFSISRGSHQLQYPADPTGFENSLEMKLEGRFVALVVLAAKARGDRKLMHPPLVTIRLRSLPNRGWHLMIFDPDVPLPLLGGSASRSPSRIANPCGVVRNHRRMLVRRRGGILAAMLDQVAGRFCASDDVVAAFVRRNAAKGGDVRSRIAAAAVAAVANTTTNPPSGGGRTIIIIIGGRHVR
jgi:hypothetical protein